MNALEPVIPASRWPSVLVVEDEPRLRSLLLDELPDLGFTAAAAKSAEDAQRLMSAAPFDIVLLDLHLPGIGGIEWFGQLRALFPRTQVIVMTGFGTLDDAQTAIRLNVVDFLRKPCHLSDIEASLERARQRWLKLGPADKTPPVVQDRTLAALEREAIEQSLTRHNGNRTAAAMELGISRRTLHNKLKAFRELGKSI